MEGVATRKLLTLGEASAYMGLSRLTLYEWVSKRKIEYIKIGRLVKFSQRTLDSWIDSHTVKARLAPLKVRATHGAH